MIVAWTNIGLWLVVALFDLIHDGKSTMAFHVAALCTVMWTIAGWAVKEIKGAIAKS